MKHTSSCNKNDKELQNIDRLSICISLIDFHKNASLNEFVFEKHFITVDCVKMINYSMNRFFYNNVIKLSIFSSIRRKSKHSSSIHGLFIKWSIFIFRASICLIIDCSVDKFFRHNQFSHPSFELLHVLFAHLLSISFFEPSYGWTNHFPSLTKSWDNKHLHEKKTPID